MQLFDIDNYCSLVNQRLDQVLLGNSYLTEASRYCVLGGGKRIRPLLAIASGKLSGAQINLSVEIGCALELIHSYSLVHDDLPAMDNDNLRRGQPTCHKKYDEATAILVGDGLQAMAFEILSSDTMCILISKQLKIINLISSASGINGMVGGQVLDLRSTCKILSLDQLKEMHSFKTGALIKAAILCGYLCGDDFSEKLYNKLENIADNLGLLFQIVDDVLDVTENSTTLGKTANKDLKGAKATYVSILGLDEAKDAAASLYNKIITELDTIENSEMLRELSISIYKRNK